MIKYLITISFVIITLISCNNKVKLNKKFGLKYYRFGQTCEYNKPDYLVDYIYVKDINIILENVNKNNLLLQLAYCKFNSNSKLNSIVITSELFENIEEYEFHTFEEKKIIAYLKFKTINNNIVPYFKNFNGLAPIGIDRQMTIELIGKTNCSE